MAKYGTYIYNSMLQAFLKMEPIQKAFDKNIGHIF